MPSAPDEPGSSHGADPGSSHGADPGSSHGPDPGSPEEALRRLEQRLDQASEAAERLMTEAAAAAAARATGGAGNPGDPATPPPAGWQTADQESRGSTSELDPLVALVQAVRDLIPPDLQQRLIAALREVLLALRALIDWYLERLDRRREQGVEVQDIPIL
ncbi:MAG TPA: hypothetical protein VMG37_08530 [Solirubrobacteraceae bacterium]|nr:hypothetical protein [Solirubrobacteraceae bacterium]